MTCRRQKHENAERKHLSPLAQAHFEHLGQIEFAVKVIKHKSRVVVKCRYPRMHLVMLLESPWSCSEFAIGAPDETDL